MVYKETVIKSKLGYTGDSSPSHFCTWKRKEVCVKRLVLIETVIRHHVLVRSALYANRQTDMAKLIGTRLQLLVATVPKNGKTSVCRFRQVI